MINKRDEFMNEVKYDLNKEDAIRIKDIKPIDYVGRNLLNVSNFEDIIDNIVEIPLRSACKIFRQKGIETVMSSANENNVLKNEQKPLERENVSGNSNFWFMSEQGYTPKYDGTDIIYQPDFEDAGKGYAWIMINFETLSNENKDLLFEMEEEKDEKGDAIGQKKVWFVEPNRISLIHRENNETDDERDIRFRDKSIELNYNNRYPKKVVILRFPVNENTRVKEVAEYFDKVAEKFREQNREERPKIILQQTK